MLNILRPYTTIQYTLAHPYEQEIHIVIPILKYSSEFIALGVRLSKHQQLYPDIAPAAQQMFTALFTYLLELL